VSSAEGLAFDSAGVLYIANTGAGTVEEYSTTGVNTKFAQNLGSFSPDFLAFTDNFGQPLSLPPPSLLDFEYWNGAVSAQNGVINGGSGTWDNVTTNWTDSSGTHTLAWGTDTAIFAGTAGTVTLGANISFQTIEFQTTGYVINANAGNTFSLIPSTGADILANSGITATINAPLTGSGSVTKSGTGTLILGGASTYTGGTTIIAGAIQLGINNALPATTALTLNSTNGGSQGLLDLHGFNQTIGSLTIVAPSTISTVVTGSGTLTLQGNVNLVDATSSAGLNASTTIAAATLDLGGAIRTFNVAGQRNVADLIVTSAIQNGGVIINAQNSTSAVPNPGTVEFSGADIYSGTTEVENGILVVGSNSALGAADGSAATGTTVDAGATLSVSNGVTVGNEALTLNGFGAGTAANSTDPQGGALNVLHENGGPSTATDNGPIIIASNASISANGGTLNLSGIASNGTTVTFNGNGADGTINIVSGGIGGNSANSNVVVDGVILNANSANTYNGTTWITNGATFNANATNALPTANGRSAVVMDPSAAISGSSAASPSKGGSTLNLGTTQAIASLTGAASSTVNLNGKILTIGNSSGGAPTTFAGAISDGTGAPGVGGLFKDGTSTQILSGVNTFSGGVSVNGGTLDVTGSLTNSPVSVVADGTLAGTGTIGSTVTVDSQGSLNPGGLSSQGTLTVGNLVLNAGSVSNFRLSQAGVIGNGVNDLVDVTNNLTIGGNLNITLVGGTGVGSYTLFTYGGTLTGSTFADITGLAGFNTTISTGVAGQVNLIVSALGTGTVQYWDGKGVINDGVITGGAGTWNTTTNDWTTSTGSSNSAWQSGTAVFGAPGGTITLGSAVTAQALIFGANGYVISGSPALTLTGPAQISVTSAANTATISAPIAGTVGLSATGAGTVILANAANTYTGTTSVSTGTLQLGTSTAAAKINAATAVNVGSGGTFSLVNVSGNTFANGVSNGSSGVGTLKINSANINTLSGVLSDGAGQLALIQSGAKTTILTNANNTYSGATTISAGTLQIGTATVAGSIGSHSAVSVGSGGTLLLVNVAGGTLANNITDGLGGTGLVNVDSTGSIALGGNLSNGVGVLALTQSGAGTTTLWGTGTYTGATTISAGTLQIGNGSNGNLSGTTVTVSGSGVLALDLGSGVTFSPNVNLSATTTALKAINTTGNIQKISGIISGTGVFDQNGAGTTIIVSGTNDTYTGATNINAGTLEVDGSLAAASTVNVGTNGTLAGAGRINGKAILTGNGVISLGSTGTIVGTLTVTDGNWNDLGTVDGVVTSSSGTLTIGSSGDLTALAGLNITGGGLAGTGAINGNVTYSSTTASTFGGVVAGTSSLTMKGSSTLTLSATNTYTGATTVSAGTLQVGNGSAGNLSGTSVVTVSGTGALAVDLASGSTFTDGVVLSGTGASFKALETGAGNSQTISGIISGTGVFNQAGTGKTIIASGTGDTYTGATNITAGTLQVDGTLAAASIVNVGTGGTLAGGGTINGKATLTGNGVISLGSTGTIAGTLTVTGGNWSNLGTVDGVVTSSGGLFNISGTVTAPAGLAVTGGTLGGTGALDGKLTYSSGTSSTFGGAIADGSALSTLTVSNSAATLTLTGANTYTGATSVNLGTLQIGNGASGNLSGTGTVTVAGSSSLAVDLVNGGAFTNAVALNATGTALKAINTVGNSQTISGIVSGTGAFDQNGAGTTIIPVGTSETYTGVTNINAGTLDVEGTLAAGSTVTVGANGTLAGGGTIHGKAIGNGTFNLSGGTIGGALAVTGGKWTGSGTVDGAVTSATGAFNIGGTLTAPLGLTVTSGTLAGSGTLVGKLTYSSATSSTFVGIIADGSAPSAVTLSNAAATLTLAGPNTYTGATTVSMGTLQIGNGVSGNLSGTGTVTLAGTSSLAMDLANGDIFTNAVVLNATGTALKAIDPVGNSQTISGLISGLGAFDQSGAGTTIIPMGIGDTYTGATNITAGTLKVDGTLAAASIVNVGTNGTLAGAGTVNGKTTLTGNGTIDLNGGVIGGGLTVTGGKWTGSGTVDGAVTSATGIFNITGTLTDPLGLTVSSGTLAGSGTLDGNLTYSSSSNSTFDGVIDGASVVTKSGAAILTLTGDNSYTGGTAITAGTVAVGDGTVAQASLGTGPVTINTSGTLSINLDSGETIANAVTDNGHVVATGSASDYTIGSAISGTGNFTKTGANAVTLTGVNTYKGGTTITAGTLALGNGTVAQASLGTGLVTINTTGTLSIDLNSGETIANAITDNGHVVATGSTSNYTIGSAISGTGNFTKTGANAVTLTGVNTYKGGTTISAGTLLVNNTSGSGTGTGTVTVANGGTLGGRGTLGGSTTLSNGGDIFPGAGTPGTAGTTLRGTSLTWNGGGAINFQIGTTADDITLSGALTKGSAGSYVIDIINTGISNTPADFTLMTFASTTFSTTDFTLELPVNVTGTLVETATSLELVNLHDPPPAEEGVEGATLIASVPYPTDQPTILLSDSGTDQQAAAPSSSVADSQTLELTPTPEPGSTLLLAFGGAALVGWRRRRR
jgi:autotransporter-associated beta strand protein